MTEPKLRADCSIGRVEFERCTQPFDRVIDAGLTRHPEVVVFDTRALFCDGERCQGRNEQLPYYFNGDRLNHLGAGMIIGKLWPVLEKLGKNDRTSDPSD